MYLQFHEDRACWFFSTIQDLWDRKAGVFAGIVLPQDRYPIPQDPVEAARYFSYAAITQRGGVVSEDPFKWVNQLRQTHPELFDPFEVVRRWPVRKIMDAIFTTVTKRETWDPPRGEQRHLFPQKSPRQPLPLIAAMERESGNKGIYKLDEFAQSWWDNSRALAERWGGNPLAIFEGVREFEEAFARVDYKNKANKGLVNFSGMRRKIWSLFVIWLQEKGLIPVFPTPVPVDFQAQRLLFAVGAVTAEELPPFKINPRLHPPDFAGRVILRVSERLTDTIAIWSQTFLVQHGFSHMAINPAMWVLSRELCPNEFQTQGRGRKKRLRLNYPEELVRRPQKWPVPYHDPAKVCPVARFCTKAIPSAPYYHSGLLLLMDRVPYPHPGLFDEIRPSGQPGKRRNDRA